MRFVLYTDKSVAQCMTAVHERMQVKATAARPAFDGWVEKGGAFALSLTTPVIGKFTRRTTLQAQVERESGITVVRGSVSSGASREGQAVVFVALVLVALTIIGSGNVLLGLLLLPVAAYLYIPLHGDYQNSGVLLDEIQKVLKAKPTPPKSLSEPKAAKSAAAPARSTTAGTRPAANGTRTTTKPKAAASASAKSASAASKPAAKTTKPKTTAPKPRPAGRAHRRMGYVLRPPRAARAAASEFSSTADESPVPKAPPAGVSPSAPVKSPAEKPPAPPPASEFRSCPAKPPAP
ncbi:MAG: hypothetical protein U0703_28895 [Anaerolineae bacterium]